MDKIRNHVALCDYCGERIMQLHRTSDSNTHWQTVKPEIMEKDWQKIRNRVRKESSWEKTKWVWRIAASVLIILIGATVLPYLMRPNYYRLANIDKAVG